MLPEPPGMREYLFGRPDVASADHNFDPEWNGRWVRWGADLDELIEPDRDGRLEQGEARAREQTNRVLARRA
jgi:hypothetical protein